MDSNWSEATQIPFASQDGGPYVGGPFRGVLHTTEVPSYTPSTTTYYGHHNPPHFTLALQGGTPVVYQHFPITRAARALQHPPHVQTNQRSAIQIEIAWRAAEIGSMPTEMVQRLWAWMRWVEDQTGVDRNSTVRFYGSEAAGIGSLSRMAVADWDTYNGWCGHQHVPGNAHWDPGRLNIDRLIRIKPPIAPEICEVKDWF